MKASDWTPHLPDGKTAASLAERDRMIVQAVADGYAMHDWQAFEHSENGHRVLVSVSRYALRIGEPRDSVRVTLSARAQAQVAELLGASLLTPKLSDLIYRKAELRLKPLTQPWWKDGSMAWTSRMVEQSRAVDALIAGAGRLPDTVDPDRGAFVANEGKDWVRVRSVPPGHACNYGWHGGSAYAVTPGLSVIQGPGTHHSVDHVDYSQTCRFVSQMAVLDSEAIRFDELLRHPAARLVAHDGPFPVGVQPAPPPPKPVQPAPPSRPPPAGASSGDLDGVPFLQARSYTPSARTGATVIVIHSMEAAEKPTTAEAVARWFAGPLAPKASAHFCVDSDSAIQSVRLRDVAWAAPGANANGIHIELAGYAKQTEAQWLDAYGMDMLARAAGVVAELCRRYSIPVEKLSVPELKAGKRGICGHHDVTLAFRKSTHTDPGRNFPWSRFLDMVRSR